MSVSDKQVTPPAHRAGPTRAMSNQMVIYYSNCALVASSPREVSLFFGRLVPVPDDKGIAQELGELYERQIYMTIEQAEDLVQMLTDTIRSFKSSKADVQTQRKS